MIGIIDYGMGNLYSVCCCLDRIGFPYSFIKHPKEIQNYKTLLLPGVGAFPDAMSYLEESGYALEIKDAVENGAFLLGICLGMQLLFDESIEKKYCKGLSLIPGKIVPFSEDWVRVPHMGWNQLEFQIQDPIAKGIEKKEDAYFVHSFYADIPSSHIIGSCSYHNYQVPAIVKKGRVYGMQFHPEKSDILGEKLLLNFKELSENENNTCD